MHLFKHFWKIALRNRAGIIVYSIISIVMLIMVCMSVKDDGDKTDETGELNLSDSLDISYADNDNSVLSKALIDYIGKTNNLTENSKATDEELNDLLYFEIVTFHIEIPEGFQSKIENDEECKVEYRTSLQQSSYSFKIENLINSYVNIYSMYVNNGATTEEAIEKTNAAIDQELDIKVYSEKEDYAGSNPKEYVIYFMSTYITYLSFGMIAMTVGKTIINSNNENVTARIGAGPVSSFKRNVINTLGLYSFALVLLIIYIAAIYIYGYDTNLVKDKGYLLIINTAIVLLTNCSMTSIIASLKVKDNTISMIVNIFGLAMSFMCGVFVPLWFLGDSVIKVARCLPFYWSTSTLAIIFPECGSGYTFDIVKVYENFGIALLYAIVLAMVAMLINKMKRK